MVKPNDEFYGNQWGLKRVNPIKGWDFVDRLKERITVAFLDTGIDENHPDLRGNMISGFNVVNNTINILDIQGHGTRIAGNAAGVSNNKDGIAGTSFNTARILPIKVTDNFEAVTPANLIAGIQQAIARGARVINMSVIQDNPTVFDQGVQNAINDAWNLGIVLVAAAGNSGVNQIYYPAAYNNVIAVTAIDRQDKLLATNIASSNYGIDADVSAPGEDIYSTIVGGGYDYGTGTSIAASFVSGLAAMLFALNPGLTNAQVIQIIRTTAGQPGLNQTTTSGTTGNQNLGPWNPYFGFGVINISRSLSVARSLV